MKVLAIIQARMSSSRLPGKVLKKIEKKTMLEHVAERVMAARLVDEVVIATTINKSDLKIVEACAKKGIRIFTGSENDVLERYYQAARLYGAEHILRITADCPMIDPTIIDRVVAKHLRTKADYTGNTVVDSYPDGYDCEIASFDALEKSHRKAVLLSEREHLTQYIKKRPKVFKIESVSRKDDLSKMRLTVDNREDLRLIRIIFNALYCKNKYFTLEDVLEFMATNSHLYKINGHIENNLGLKLSLQNDQSIKNKGKKNGKKPRVV